MYKTRIVAASITDKADIKNTHPGSDIAKDRGTLIHALLQNLPSVRVDQRTSTAKRIAAQLTPDLPDTARDTAIEQALTILNTPDLAWIFDGDSLSEAPILKAQNGSSKELRADKILIQDQTVTLIDYKSDAPVPAPPPQEYLDQIAAYKHALRAVFTGYEVKSALLWTSNATLEWI